ncbi:MAG: hypothetical protein ACJA1B_002187 [Polaribacter sp.]|jgi:hypothetical protein
MEQEKSFYCISQTKDSELIWKGYIDLVNPQPMEETVNDYPNLFVLLLEKEILTNKKSEKVKL